MSTLLSLVLVSLVGVPAAPPAVPATSPTLCTQPLAQVAQAAPSETAEKIDLGVTAQASCTADCGPYANVSCNNSTTCSAVDRNCSAGQQGYVICDGSTTSCPACPSTLCTDGQIKSVQVGPQCGCPQTPGATEKERYQCINGEWVYQSTFCGAPFCIQFQ